MPPPDYALGSDDAELARLDRQAATIAGAVLLPPTVVGEWGRA